MAALKLSYCQLIRIILAQLGGNPLQQVYTQLVQGMPSISVRSGLFSELTQIKAVIDEVTNRIQLIVKDVNDYEKMARELANQFMKNPMKASIEALRTQVQSRLNAITPGPDDPPSEEYIALQNLNNDLATLLDITDKISGVSPGAGGQTCSLADLLGNGCTPAKNIPDIDLQTLIGALNKQNILNALTTALANGTGYNQLQASIVDLRNSVTSILNSFNNIFTKAFIKNAVTAYVNQILFQLLSGCGNDVLRTTLRDYTGISYTGIDIPQMFSTGNSGTTTITLSGTDLANVVVGQTVVGTNVAAETKILSINELLGTVTISRPLIGKVQNNLTYTYSNTGANLNIANALTEATEYLQDIYGSGNVTLSNSYAISEGNVLVLPNLQSNLNIASANISFPSSELNNINLIDTGI